MSTTRLPKKFRNRVLTRLRSFQEIAAEQRQREVSEADTVSLVKDMLGDLFGYDKYRDLAGEVRLQGGVCDLAIRLGGRLRLLIEVKAAGVALCDQHAHQAVNYGARAGVDWVVVTNAVEWRIYRLVFERPVQADELVRLHLADLRPKARHDLERLFLLTHEGLVRGALDAWWRPHQVVNHFTLAQILMSGPLLGLVRSEMRRLYPGEIRADDITRLLVDGVFKPEVLQGRRMQEARHRLGLGGGET